VPETSLAPDGHAVSSVPCSVEKVVGYPPLVDMDDRQRREFQEALLDADSFEDLPGKWQAAILEAEAGRPQLRVVSGRLATAGPVSA
jgi:hypothetical protein